MESLTNDIRKALLQCKAEILAAMDAKNINASGRTARSLQVVETNDTIGLYLVGKDHAPLSTLEIGRPGGRVPKGFYQIIKQWTYDKNLQFSSERERATFAYFTARKIAADGTKRHEQPVEVYSVPVQQAKTNIHDILVRAFGTALKTATTNF